MEIEKIIQVNELLGQAFGRGFKGNITYEGNPWDGIYAMRETDTLKNIHKKTLFTQFGFFFFGIPRNAGWFSDGDPTKINVRKRYIKQGRKYAELYRKETPLSVEVNELNEKADWRIS